MAEKLTVNLAGNIVRERIGDISIMLIDNDSISVASLTSMLEQFSYKVMSVNVASEAVSMIEKQKDIGLVIANIEIPHIDSHSFLTALLHKEIPLVLISPEINTKETSDLLTKSACFCLKKPVSENDIKNLWQHVAPKKSQELEKINIAEQQENVMEESVINQIESFRETIKRQRTSQLSLLGRRRPFIKRFTTSETYQKRKVKAVDEGKTKPVYPTDEAENKREEGSKMESNVGRRCNLWTNERHMKFLTAISILGEKDSRPKSILRIMNDSNLNHRQVGSHLQKYKYQVERVSDTLSRNEWRSTDKTFDYPSDYEYPFSASNLTTNLIENNTSWFSLRKKTSSSSSIDQYSFATTSSKRKAKMPKFHLGGKLDLSKHSLFGNVLNKSPMEVNYVPSATSNNPPANDVNHSGLSSDNPPVLPDLPSSVGASNIDAVQMESHGICIPQSDPNPFQLPSSYVLETDMNQLDLDPNAFQMESAGICIPQSEPNPFQSPSSFVHETDRNQLDLAPIYIPNSYVFQADLCTMGESYFLLDPDYTMNPLETNMEKMGWVPSTENISHHESNMNQMDWIPTTENYVLPQTDMNIIVPETNTTHMGWVSSGEGYVASENMIPSETNINQMGRVSFGENHVLSQDMIFHETNTNHVGFVSGQSSYEVPPQTNMTTILETSTDQMDWLFSEESFLLLEGMTSFETNTTQSLETNMEDMGLVPSVEDNDVPIEDLISFDIDVNETDTDSWLENHGSSEENIPLSTSYIGHDFAFNTLMDPMPHTTMEDHDQSLAMNLESTSQQHNMMESCGYQNIKVANPREAIYGGRRSF